MLTPEQVKTEYVGKAVEEIGSISDYFAVVEDGKIIDLVDGNEYQTESGIVHGVLNMYDAEKLKFDEREGVYYTCA